LLDHREATTVKDYPNALTALFYFGTRFRFEEFQLGGGGATGVWAEVVARRPPAEEIVYEVNA
jgi:hypothetical protein